MMMNVNQFIKEIPVQKDLTHIFSNSYSGITTNKNAMFLQKRNIYKVKPRLT